MLVDYCPDVLRDKDPRNPIQHMWDTDEESREMCRLSLPAILKNADKFDKFYQSRFRRTKQMYTFCIDEFQGFDDGYYAEYPCMKNCSVAYAASFGDSHFGPETYDILEQRLKNFKAIGLREGEMLAYVRAHTTVPVQRVLDPTLLLTAADYDSITATRLEKRPYLLLYARRYNPAMSAYAEQLAQERGWEIIEISLRAVNVEKHKMFYEAGVEEFLSLVKHAEFVVTNSYHGIIFSLQFQREFRAFSREQCDTKISELLDLLSLSTRLARSEELLQDSSIPYQAVNQKIQVYRLRSLQFLKDELNWLTEEAR